MTRLFHLKLAAGAALCLLASGCAKHVVAVKTPDLPAAVADTRPATAPVRTGSPDSTRSPQPVARTASSNSRVPDAATRARIDELLGHIQDAYFEYDRHSLSDGAVAALSSDSRELAIILNQYPGYKVRVEGYCDERGSAEYNMALGEARAKAAKDYLVSAGVGGQQLSTVSYGKEKQSCEDHDEACWSKNRRVHIIALKDGL